MIGKFWRWLKDRVTGRLGARRYVYAMATCESMRLSMTSGLQALRSDVNMEIASLHRALTDIHRKLPDFSALSKLSVDVGTLDKPSALMREYASRRVYEAVKEARERWTREHYAEIGVTVRREIEAQMTTKRRKRARKAARQ